MFYSQFILAKKGPLGTIWIAAHLERKLRKNQVADTDIGVSVDSIICPDVPIALRLSSHLMLGVVRIYSRKVNYLFHDCSEALLKIKQAFRSAAVDLPPEESTAPYHSITLPETFDLDDFELPDNAIFDGDYVDHHVSTREQITLQDTMNGAMFSTTQFGLDERFGDGDASQIGIDLDEEIFLEKGHSHENNFIAPEENNRRRIDAEPEAPFTNMDVDGRQDGFGQLDHGIADSSKNLLNQDGSMQLDHDVADTSKDLHNQDGSRQLDHGIADGSKDLPNQDGLGQHDHGIADTLKDLPNQDGFGQRIHDIVDTSKDLPNQDGFGQRLHDIADTSKDLPNQDGFGQRIHGIADTSKDLPHAYGYNIRTPDLNEMISSAEGTGGISLPSNYGNPSFLVNNGASGEHSDHAQAPPTPGLLEEVIPVHAQEIPDICQLDKPSPSNDMEKVAPEAAEVDYQNKDTNIKDELSSLPECSVGIIGGNAEAFPVTRVEKMRAFDNEAIPSERVAINHRSTAISPQEASMHDQGYPGGTTETPIMKRPVGELVVEGDSSSLTDNRPVYGGLFDMESTVFSHSDKPDMQNTVLSHSDKPEMQATVISHHNKPEMQTTVLSHSDKPEMQATVISHRNKPEMQTTVLSHSYKPEARPYSSQEPVGQANSSLTFNSHAPVSSFGLRPCFAEDQTHALSLEGHSLSANNLQSGAAVPRESAPSARELPGNQQGFFPLRENAPNVCGLGKEQGFPPPKENAPSVFEQLGKDYSLSANNLQLIGAVSRENASPACGPLGKEQGFPPLRENAPNVFGQLGKDYSLSPNNLQSRGAVSRENASPACGPLGKEQGFPPLRENAPNVFGQLGKDYSFSANNLQSRGAVSRENASSASGPLGREQGFPTLSENAPNVFGQIGKDYSLSANNLQSRGAVSRENALPAGGPLGKVQGFPPLMENAPNAFGQLGKDYSLSANNLQSRGAVSRENAPTAHGTLGKEQGFFPLRENAPNVYGLLGKEQGSFPLRENAPNVSGLLGKEQGEDFRSANLFSEIPMHKNLETAPLNNSNLNKEYYLPSISACIQTENPYCSASSEYPEPERMLRATVNEYRLHREIEQSTVEKGVTESDGSVDRLQTLSGKKRPTTESTVTLLNESSINLPGEFVSTKNIGSTPDDNDLLASILVGRTTPSLKVKPTPPLPMIPSSKRARLNSKTGTPKRKVLLDDTMVLHADTIRQQLMSTEDIRRVRKKAACTRSDIWRIQKCLVEEELFGECTLTGISDDLTLLHYRVYNLNDTFKHRVDAVPSFKIGADANPSHAQMSEEQTWIKAPSADAVPSADANIKELDIPVMSNIINDNVNQVYSDVNNLVQETNCDLVENSLANDLCPIDNKIVEDVPHRSDNTSSIVSDLHGTNFTYSPLLNNGEMTGVDQGTESVSLFADKNSVEELSFSRTDGLHLPPEQNSSGPSAFTVAEAVTFNDADNLNTENVGTVAESSEDKVSSRTFVADMKENGLEIRKEDIADNQNMSPCYLPPETATIDQAAEVGSEVNRDGQLDSSCPSGDGHHVSLCPLESVHVDIADNHNMSCHFPPETATIDQAVEVESGVSRDGQLESSCPSGGGQHVSLCPLESENVTENAVSTVGETSGIQEVNAGVPAVMETDGDGATGDSCDDGSAVDGDDAEFLNVDDEVDFDDENNYDVPNPEEAQSQENSGWSARTRGVARYLKLLFDEGTGHTREVVALDRLLSGKTRKEASRMFFETLVLKTKDYIHVEQENSFGSIDIKPRSKLLKLEF